MLDRADSRAVSSAAGAAVAIATLVIATLALRLPGAGHGAPRFLFHPDVAKQALVARDVADAHVDLRFEADDPKRRYYPYGTSVLLGRLHLAADLADGAAEPSKAPATTEERWHWAWRLRVFGIAIFLGAGGIAVGMVARRVGPLVGSLFALLLAADPILVEHSHYGMNDVPLASFLLLVWVLQPTRRGDPRSSPLVAGVAGLALGIAFGIKYQAVVGLWFPLLSLRLPERRIARLAAVACGGVIGLWATTPLLFLEPRAFVGGVLAFLAWQTNVTGVDAPLAVKAADNLRWLGAFALREPTGWLVPLAIIGAVRGRRARAVDVGSAAVSVVTLVVLLVGSRDLMRKSDLLPAVPLLAALASLALVRRPDTSPAARIAVAGFATAVLGTELLAGSRVAAAFTRPDTRLRALAWLESRATPETRVLSERYTLPDHAFSGRETRARFLFEAPAAGRLARGDFDYVVSSSLASDRFFDPRSPVASEDARTFYRALERDLPLVASFTDRELDFLHPRITIRARPETGPATDRSRSDE